MKNFAERFVLILVPLLLAACVPTVDTACDSVDGLTAALRDSGAEADSGEQIDQSFFTVPAQRLVVNAEDVQVFAYPSVDLARSDAAQVSPDGYSVGYFHGHLDCHAAFLPVREVDRLICWRQFRVADNAQSTVGLAICRRIVH